MNEWTNESNDISFYIPLFVFVSWMCVSVYVYFHYGCVSLDYRLCDYVSYESLCACIYFCIEFYFASLIQNHSLLFLFFMKQSRCTKKYVFFYHFFKNHCTLDSNAGPNLSS